MVNTVSLVDCDVLTRRMGELQSALVSWASHGEDKLGGDRDVIVHAIMLRDRLMQVIERSRVANAPKVGEIS